MDDPSPKKTTPNGPPKIAQVNILKKFEMCFQQLKIWKKKIGISPTNIFCLASFYVMQSCTLYENSIS